MNILSKHHKVIRFLSHYGNWGRRGRGKDRGDNFFQSFINNFWIPYNYSLEISRVWEVAARVNSDGNVIANIQWEYVENNCSLVKKF